ncbi:PREDICTED: ADP-ribosylation factor-like protein 2-binding protein [Polistes dominula]|uniref:ADP-ribosylation factor-like protein 2-binding protein n=1 Tax=Polistes dominula TaxID=743375 RepID=A0ABM1IRA4_POLDO|nr:PREDICTED: ADP-ribosylation factor-like protein 2-binding protein [Polistes dominula]XP_015182740.1 PREDICTED: ADP-ribosylation factor-like protein 2-binding protein [Polistes dominula]XP_015182741.1 PREDICTED: ADP-ribosylation factor-like protein 2-binding protein [Polistes dominula]
MENEMIDDCLEISPEQYSEQTTKIELFDVIIGHIEDLLLDYGFYDLQNKFLEKYWTTFEPAEENKLIYTEIFNEYNAIIETHIVNHLKQIIPHFNMDIFLRDLRENKADLDGEVFDILSTITDFQSFKEMVLDYRAVKEGTVPDLSSGISVTSVKYQ